MSIVEIKELDPDIIPPISSRANDPNYNGGSKIVVVGKPGCFAPGTPVMMYDGTLCNVENVQVGQIIMGDDNTPRTVLELCKNNSDMYEVIPNNVKEAEPYVVNKEHKLVLKDLNNPQNDVIEISVQDYIGMDNGWKKKWGIFRSPVNFPHQQTPINPYILGLWLGFQIDIDVEDALLDFISKYDEYIRDVDTLNLRNLVSSSIPEEFKFNNRDVRLKVLAGLIDATGVYTPRHNTYEITYYNENLVDDIVYISRTLGFFAKKYTCKYSDGDGVITKYRVVICGPLQTIPSNNFTFMEHTNKIKNLLTPFSLVKKGPGDYYGFTLDGNHRFLLGSCDVVRNTGKSTLIKALLHSKKHIFPVGMAMSGSEDSNHAYRQIMPSTFVFNEYDEEKIKEFIKRQKLAHHHLPNPWAVMILDDCTDDPKIFNRPLQQALYKKGRHWKMMYILSLQYAMDVKPVIRTNVDGIFILREPLLKNREALYKNYASIIPDFNTFCELMDQLTDDYCAIYIHGATQTNTWQECVYYWKAPMVPNGWKFGCQDYWDFHHNRYNPDYTETYGSI